jgi:hypothetical protein
MLIVAPLNHPSFPNSIWERETLNPMILTTYNINPTTKFAPYTKYALKKAFKIVKNQTKNNQNRTKSYKIVQNHIKIVRYSLLFLSINKPLPILECGGKRSATPLWMPQRLMMKQIK